ncbi:MAG: deoxyuridine 5'-triphosphate nucleotidohydrolase [Clostridiales bacterium]|nr:deoxyuridine 5'-triphosphate nucleotidohydrolase [Clostridiales bacterium]
MKSIGQIPKRQTLGSCGYDFYAPEDIVLTPGEWTTIDTGVRFDGKELVESLIDYPVNLFQAGWFMMVVPRSGFGSKYGFRFRNTVGIIDMDYRDTIKATMTADVPLTIKKGDRFMQGIILPFGVFEDEEIPKAERNGGHGSTGVN